MIVGIAIAALCVVSAAAMGYWFGHHHSGSKRIQEPTANDRASTIPGSQVGEGVVSAGAFVRSDPTWPGPVDDGRRAAPSEPTFQRELFPLPLVTSSGTAGLSIDSGRVGRFNMYAATQLGVAHALKSAAREDAYALGGAAGWEGCIVAVADGLGAARNSHMASLTAARVAVSWLSGKLVPGLTWRPEQWTQLAADCTSAVSQHLVPDLLDSLAEGDGFRPGRDVPRRKADTDPASTLLFAVLTLGQANTIDVSWASVGDSRLAAVDPAGEFTWISAVSFDDFQGQPATALVSNSVDSLPKEPERLQTGTIRLDAGTAVLLASDGLTTALDLAPDYFAGAIRQMIPDQVRAHTFGALLDFDIRQLYDDRTLVAIWPSPIGGTA